jgi:hypothetical protein
MLGPDEIATFSEGRSIQVISDGWLQHPRGLGVNNAASSLEPLKGFQHPRSGVAGVIRRKIRRHTSFGTESVTNLWLQQRKLAVWKITSFYQITAWIAALWRLSRNWAATW